MKSEIKLYPLFTLIERTKDGDEIKHFSSYNWTPVQQKMDAFKLEFPQREYFITSYVR
jgi:hypothetical protein